MNDSGFFQTAKGRGEIRIKKFLYGIWDVSFECARAKHVGHTMFFGLGLGLAQKWKNARLEGDNAYTDSQALTRKQNRERYETGLGLSIEVLMRLYLLLTYKYALCKFLLWELLALLAQVRLVVH